MNTENIRVGVNIDTTKAMRALEELSSALKKFDDSYKELDIHFEFLREEERCSLESSTLEKNTGKITLNNLKYCFESAISKKAKYIGVAVSVEGGYPEIIVNSNYNFKSKLEYYLKAYNNDLTLKVNDKVKIIGFTHADSLEEIESLLIQKEKIN